MWVGELAGGQGAGVSKMTVVPGYDWGHSQGCCGLRCCRRTALWFPEKGMHLVVVLLCEALPAWHCLAKGEVSPHRGHAHPSPSIIQIPHPPHTVACLPHACTPLPLSCQEFLLPPIPQLLGLDVPEAAAGSSISQQQYSFGCNSRSSGGSSVGALALPGAGAGGLMLQAWNFTGMLSGGGLGGRGGQNPAAGGGQGGGGRSSVQQGQGGGGGQAAAAVVEDAISRAQQLRDQLYGQQLMQGFDPQELRMVRGGGRGIVVVWKEESCAW